MTKSDSEHTLALTFDLAPQMWTVTVTSAPMSWPNSSRRRTFLCQDIVCVRSFRSSAGPWTSTRTARSPSTSLPRSGQSSQLCHHCTPLAALVSSKNFKKYTFFLRWSMTWRAQKWPRPSVRPSIRRRASVQWPEPQNSLERSTRTPVRPTQTPLIILMLEPS